jgi:hypothetical protein
MPPGFIPALGCPIVPPTGRVEPHPMRPSAVETATIAPILYRNHAGILYSFNQRRAKARTELRAGRDVNNPSAMFEADN